MANGQIVDRLINSPALPRLAALVRLGQNLRNTLGRNPTDEELEVAVAKAVVDDPALASDINMENPANSRTVRGMEAALQGYGTAAVALVVAWRTGDWDSVITQVTILLPVVYGLLGNAIALFGRKAADPDPNFRIWKPATWFRSNPATRNPAPISQ